MKNIGSYQKDNIVISRLSVVLLLAAAILACLAGTVSAQGMTGGIESGGMELSLFQDIPSVYSASKHEQMVTEAPAFVSIVTAEEIQKYGYRTLGDVLRSLPGFYVTYDRNYEYLGARGFSRPGDYNTRLLQLIDGVRLNDSVYDSASIGTELPLDLDLISRIEVVRGPASSLYGSNALFGVINIITRRGRDVQGVEASAEAGSFETYKARLSYGRRLSSGLEYLLSGTFSDSQGQDQYFAEFDDPATNNGVFEDGDGREFHSLFGKVSYLDFTLEGAYGDQDKEIPTGAYDTVFNDGRTYTEDVQAFVDLRYEKTFPEGLDLLARAYYSTYPYKGDYVYDYAEEGDEEPYIVINKDESEANWWGGEVQATKALFSTHRLTLGGEFRRNSRQDQKNYDEEVYLDDRRDSYAWSLYAQDEWRIAENLILNAGARYDYFEEYEDNTNPRLALIWSPLEKTTFKILYGEAFRIPNVFEQYYNDGGFTTKTAGSLEPESIRTYEVILEQFLGSRLRATVAAFYYEMDDLITLELDPEDELLVFKNVDQAETRGLELELEGRLPVGLEARFSYTYQDAEDVRSGEALTNSPRHMIKLNAIAPLVAERLFAGAEVQYESGRKAKGGVETGDVVLVNLTLFNFTLPGRLQLSGSLYNAFDADIDHPASEEHLQEFLRQDGRSFRLKATVNF